MSATIETPTERECERCGRREVWDEASGTWSLAVEDGERVVGNVYCIHEWDINGSFVPVRKADA
jgi:hypothetical protein